MNKKSLFYLAKRDALPWHKTWLIRGVAIVLALIFCSLITMLLTGLNPVQVFSTIFYGAFGTARKTWVTAQNLAILLGISLAITPAFKMRFWNIGAEGQVLIGCLACAACMITLEGKVSSGLMVVISLAASLLAGAVWGFLPAFFKANWETNETLFTLMMNYIAIQIVSYFVYIWSVPAGSGKIGVINGVTEAGWLPTLGNQKYMLNIIVVALLTAGVYVYLKYSKHGYEISVVGESVNTAKYIGINVRKVIIRTMLLSGALCGIAGLLLVAGTDHTLTRDTAAGRGFTAIMVSWLAKFNPLYMILTSFLIVFLQKGAIEISTVFGLNDSFSDIITGIIIFFIIGSEFFINYTVKFRQSKKEAAK